MNDLHPLSSMLIDKTEKFISTYSSNEEYMSKLYGVTYAIIRDIFKDDVKTVAIIDGLKFEILDMSISNYKDKICYFIEELKRRYLLLRPKFLDVRI